MQNLFRLRIEAAAGLENQTVSYVDATEADRESSLAVFVQWQDRALKPVLETLFQDFVRDYRDSGSIVSPGSFLERLVQSLDNALGHLEPERFDAFDLGVVLCCGRGLYVLHSGGLEPRFSLGGAPQLLQPSMRVRIKDLSPGTMRQSHMWSDLVVERLRLLRVFFEDEDRAMLWLAARGETLQSPGQPLQPEFEASYAGPPPRQGALIVVTKEPAPDAAAAAAPAHVESGWPELDEAPRRDRRTFSYAAVGLVVLLFGTALFGVWRWQRIGRHAAASGADALISEAVDSSLEPRQETARVSGDVVQGDAVAAPDADATLEPHDGKSQPRATGVASQPLRVLWSKHHTNWVTSSPRLAQGRVVYGCRDGHLYAVDTSGKTLWEYDSKAGIGATPAVDDDRVYCGNYAGRVFALHAKDGEAQWSVELGARIVAGPATNHKLVFVATYAGELVALKKKNGEVVWRRQVGGKLRAAPLVAEDHIFIASGGREMLCLKQDNGETRWSCPVASEVQSSPLCADGKVLFGCKDGSVCAVSIQDGGIVWRQRVQGVVQPTGADPKDLVYVVSGERRLYAIQPEKGEVAWSFQAHAAILSTPCVQEGKVYLTAYDRRTYVLDAASGRALATARLGAPIFSSPLVVAGHIYCGSNDGTVYCMNDVD